MNRSSREWDFEEWKEVYAEEKRLYKEGKLSKAAFTQRLINLGFSASAAADEVGFIDLEG